MPIGAREKKLLQQRIKEQGERGRNVSWFVFTVHLTGIHLEIICVFRRGSPLPMLKLVKPS